MKDISLFATRLRSWRTSNGTHGRMTQEALADLLDVSVDAVGKYERSVSFIRGDLEHRLVEKLGWTQQEVIACREDWEMHHRLPRSGGYRLLDQAVIEELYDGSWTDAIRAMITFVGSVLGELPEDCAPDEDVFLPIYDAYRTCWQAVVCDGQIVAKWALLPLLPEDEALFLRGQLRESDLCVGRIRQLILPGTFFGYCPALVVAAGHEAASTLMLSSFVTYLEHLSSLDIYVHGIGAITVSPSGAQLCHDIGMTKRGGHFSDPAFETWELPGAAIPGSIFGRRNSAVQQRYAMKFRNDSQTAAP